MPLIINNTVINHSITVKLTQEIHRNKKEKDDGKYRNQNECKLTYHITCI